MKQEMDKIKNDIMTNKSRDFFWKVEKKTDQDMRAANSSLETRKGPNYKHKGEQHNTEN